MNVPAAELAQIQADLAAAVCDKACVIQRAPDTTDTWGSPAKGTYATISTTVCGMTQPTAGQLQNYAFRIESLAAWQVKLPYGTDCRVDDQLLIEGNTLQVHVILDPHSVPGMLTVLAAELKP
ncbi:MAG: hypothetical protein ACRDHW_00890 [Ktedonobacteraceae bacterium]